MKLEQPRKYAMRTVSAFARLILEAKNVKCAKMATTIILNVSVSYSTYFEMVKSKSRIFLIKVHILNFPPNGKWVWVHLIGNNPYYKPKYVC